MRIRNRLVRGEDGQRGVYFCHGFCERGAYDFLLRRARACQRERRHIPNIISVDFYSVGDLVRVANTLNGIDSTVAVSSRGR